MNLKKWIKLKPRLHIPFAKRRTFGQNLVDFFIMITASKGYRSRQNKNRFAICFK